MRKPFAVAAALLLAGALGSAAAIAAPPQGTPSRDTEVEPPPPAPVLIEGEPIIWITTGLGPYSPEFRANRIQRRLDEAVHDRALRDLTVAVTEVDGSSEIRVGPRLLMVVTAADASAVRVGRASLAQQYAHSLEAALRGERERYAPATLLRSTAYAVAATVLFAAVVWVVVRLSARIRRGVRDRVVPWLSKWSGLTDDAVSLDRIERTLASGATGARIVLLVLALQIYLTYVLGLFPWTRAVSLQLFQYVVTPIRAFGQAFVGYLPNLLFVLVTACVMTLAIRLVGLFFRQIERQRFVFNNFPPEWAIPTYKIVRALLIAFGLVVAFPYLPASQSPAFTGVSVFMGVLISLASSSALSNIIAGLVLTYTGAFRLGDRVRIGEAFGDIMGTSLLATRIRTIKNEEITIPNGIVLGSAVTNYTRESHTSGLILHTSVTIGYDAPWRRVHELLIEAALATPDVLTSPKPFVWQTALNDFYVTYEINAYTASPQTMTDTYAALHARIQDAFYAAGVEIMSPHYTSVRDGNTVAIPAALRAPDYQARPFTVETLSRDSRKSHGV